MKHPAGDSEHRERLRSRPHLLRYYEELVDFLNGRLPLDERAYAAAFRLALASEYFLLPTSTLIARALAKGEFHEFADILFALTQAGFPFAKAFLALYQHVDYPVKDEAPVIIRLVRDALRPIPKSEKVLDFIFSSGDAEVFRFLLRAVAVIASAVPGTLAELLPLLDRHRRSLSRPLFFEWLSRGCDLMTSRRVEEGVAYFKLESKQSRRLLNLHYVALRDMKRVLDIYSSSLAGRSLAILDREVSVFGLEAPFTDGRSVFLPPRLDYFRDHRENERAYAALTAVQAATVAYGTYGFDLARIAFRSELADRYGTQLPDVLENAQRQYRGRAEEVREKRTGEIEAVFKGLRKIVLLETQLEKFFYSFPTPDLVKTVFTLVETVRIEGRLAEVYPGLREDFGVLNRHLWEKRPALGATEDNSIDKFRTLLEALVQISLMGKTKGGDLGQSLATALAKMTAELGKIGHGRTTVEDSASISFAIYNIFFELFPLVSITRRVDLRDLTGGIDVIELVPEIVADSSPDLVTFTDNRFSHENLTEDDEAALDLGSTNERTQIVEGLKKALADGSVRVFRYDEFDHLKGVMCRRHCTLYERDLEPRDPLYFDAVIARHQAVYKRLRKKLLNLKPEEVEFSRKWLAGDEINLQDAVDFAIDLARGQTPEEKIYVKKIRNRRDVAAAILLDSSSSTEELVLGGRIIDIEKDALCLLGQTLEAIGDDFSVYSVASNGRQRVDFNIVKNFDEPWGRRVQARIGAIEPVASNRDGCAVRHAAAKLAALPHKTKLLLILSDGIPADVDYGSTSNVETSQYAIEDTRQAILSAKKAGIVPYCLTIDRTARDYISRLYGAYHFQILPEVARLPEKLSKLYLRLTG
jgi:nitric oxide reductase NorD protein